MPLSKPVRLDPYQRIVNVGWGGADILVLEFRYQRNGPRPAFTLRDLPFTSTTYDLFDSVIVNNDGARSPTPGNPITNDMLKFLRLWNRPPYFRTIEGSSRGNAILFFNLRKIRAGLPRGASTFTLKIDTPGTTGGRTETETTYYVWLPFVSWEEALEHPGLWIDSVWGTAAEAEARLSNLSGGGGQSSAYVIRAEPFSYEIPDTLSWDLQATTYRKQRDFPVDAQNRPDWDIDQAIGGTNEDGAGSSASTPLPSYVVTVEVDIRTLSVGSHKS